MKKTLIFSLVVFFCAVVGVSYIPQRIQQEMSGFELIITGEDTFEVLQEIDIRIDGRMRYGMFARYQKFDGAIEVSAFPSTLDNPYLNITFLHGISAGGSMSYVMLDSPFTRIETIGWLYPNEDFSSLMILLTEWTYMEDGSSAGRLGNRIIVAPAVDAYAAYAALRNKGVVLLDDGSLWYPVQIDKR